MTYDQLADHVEAVNIQALEARVAKALPPVSHDGSRHEAKVGSVVKEHRLDVFRIVVREFYTPLPDIPGESSLIDADVVFQWKYCPYCKEVRQKRLIGYHRDENMAFVREIINKGVQV